MLTDDWMFVCMYVCMYVGDESKKVNPGHRRVKNKPHMSGGVC